MSAQTNANPQPAAARAPYTTGTVTARDGVALGYRQLGHGQGVVMLHGAMESAASHMALAQALADEHTVYLLDRRGRGLSGPFAADYGMRNEVDDLADVLSATGAHDVFGVSAGGLVCLQAALALPAIQRVAVYEPALVTGRAPDAAAVLRRYDREMAQGKLAAALVTGMVGAQMGPAFLRLMPRWLLERFTTQGMAAEDRQAAPGTVTMRQLAPTLHYDFTLVAALAGQQERFRAVQQPVLLLGGSQSPNYLKTGLAALEKILPHARRVELAGLDHGGSSDPTAMNRTSDPARVAVELRRFYA
ncbi:MAG TPA: alpha/beta hydrolase [Ktedonobacterales bacterium]|nr:alpha/beta hydrolase [Ktedonobacterales bacterium]